MKYRRVDFEAEAMAPVVLSGRTARVVQPGLRGTYRLKKNVTEELLSFAAGLNLEGISADVLRGAKLSILDGLGTALLASGHEKSRQIAGALIEISPGDINLWGYSSKASPLAACTINGTLVEGLGYSDIHVDAGLHPTGAVLPAVLTFGEAHRKGGEETLVSFILGCEVMIRVGLSAPRRFHRRGFQPTSVIGVLGAALAVSKIMGLHRPQMDNALSLATTVAFGPSLCPRRRVLRRTRSGPSRGSGSVLCYT